jgi:TolB-like protein/DNA-binding winged helix-turn-helix (wHTH) protein
MKAPSTIILNGMIVDLANETLISASSERISLRPQTFSTLRFLLENGDRLVTKDELVHAVWNGLAVTDDSLVQCVHEIRRAIGDEQHLLLQTVSKRGYRMILPRADGMTAKAASLAVLPFVSLGRGQQYFADGLADDLITSLARIPGLFVIARNSSFSYRNKTIDSRRIAAELGVNYLIDGSVRRFGDRIRINCQLVDGATASHVWTGSFEGVLKDVFELQYQLVSQIAGIVEPTIRAAEIDKAYEKRTENLSAYDFFLRALPHAHANSPADVEIALGFLNSALQLDAGFMASHAYAAWCFEQRYFRYGFDPQDRDRALMHADTALGVNCRDPRALSIAAFVRAILTRNYAAAIPVLDRALAMNSNSALAYGFSALVSAHDESHERAIDHAHRALRLSPVDDPLSYHPYCALALTHLFAEKFQQSIAYGRLTVQANPGFSPPYVYLVVALIRQGKIEEARSVATRLLEVAPNFSVRNIEKMKAYRPDSWAFIATSLRQLGSLPE